MAHRTRPDETRCAKTADSARHVAFNPPTSRTEVSDHGASSCPPWGVLSPPGGQSLFGAHRHPVAAGQSRRRPCRYCVEHELQLALTSGSNNADAPSGSSTNPTTDSPSRCRPHRQPGAPNRPTWRTETHMAHRTGPRGAPKTHMAHRTGPRGAPKTHMAHRTRHGERYTARHVAFNAPRRNSVRQDRRLSPPRPRQRAKTTTQPRRRGPTPAQPHPDRRHLQGNPGTMKSTPTDPPNDPNARCEGFETSLHLRAPSHAGRSGHHHRHMVRDVAAPQGTVAQRAAVQGLREPRTRPRHLQGAEGSGTHQRRRQAWVVKPFITDANRCARGESNTSSSEMISPSGPASGTRQFGYSSTVPGWF